jgi:hypothetical protein
MAAWLIAAGSTPPPCAPSLWRGLPRYDAWCRPCAPLPSSRPPGAAPCASPCASVLPVPTFRPTASDRRRPPACRMSLRPSAGTAGAAPAGTTPRGFDSVPTLSTRPQCFPGGPLPVSHLTWFFPGLCLLCSRPWLVTTAAGGGLEPAPASGCRGASPQQLSSDALRRSCRSPSRSWRTVVGIPNISEASVSWVVWVSGGELLHFPPYGFCPF